jgi:hypothetical protein
VCNGRDEWWRPVGPRLVHVGPRLSAIMIIINNMIIMFITTMIIIITIISSTPPNLQESRERVGVVCGAGAVHGGEHPAALATRRQRQRTPVARPPLHRSHSHARHHDHRVILIRMERMRIMTMMITLRHPYGNNDDHEDDALTCSSCVAVSTLPDDAAKNSYSPYADDGQRPDDTCSPLRPVRIRSAAPIRSSRRANSIRSGRAQARLEHAPTKCDGDEADNDASVDSPFSHHAAHEVLVVVGLGQGQLPQLPPRTAHQRATAAAYIGGQWQAAHEGK